jgi:predicted lipase
LKKYPNATILNTGHSLGAALTSISAVELNKKFPNKVKEIHNFGCPRIGNEELAKNI